MRVLVLAHSVSDVRGGGEAIGAYELLSHVARQGVELEVVTAAADIQTPLPKNCHLRVAPGAESGRWGHSGRNKAALLREARRAVRAHRYDAVHLVTQFTSFPIPSHPFLMSGCHGLEPALERAPPRWPRLAQLGSDARRHGLRSVLGDLTYAVKQERFRRWTLDRTFRETDLVIVRESLGIPDLKPLARRIEYLPFGVNTGPRPSPHRSGDPRVLFAGRLEPDKGVDVLIEAFRAVRTQIPKARLDIVGAGAKGPPLERQARAAGLGDHVRFYGHIPRPQLRPFYERAWVFVLPSRGESFGQVNLEAMSAGTPVVTTPHVTGAHDYLEDGVNGRLVPANDPARLAQVVQELLEDSKARQRMGAAARRTAERFDWARIAQRQVQLYENVLAYA